MDISPDVMQILTVAFSLFVVYFIAKKILSLLLTLSFLLVGGLWYLGFQQVSSNEYGSSIVDKNSVVVYEVIENVFVDIKNISAK